MTNAINPNPAKVPTDVILVVKGAGIQKANATLDVFLNGFWPAVLLRDPLATMSQRDVAPASDPRSSQRVTEIITKEHRLWVKESYWETDLVPAGSFTALAREWRMATFTFGDTICMWIVSQLLDTVRTKVAAMSKASSASRQSSPTGTTAEHRSPDPTGLGQSSSPYPFWAYPLSFAIVHWSVIVVPLWTILQRYLPEDALATNLLVVALLALLPALLIAIMPSARALRVGKARKMASAQPQNNTDILPGTANWVLGILIAAFLLNPGQYLLILGYLALTQLAFLWARASVWRYRLAEDSDTSTDTTTQARKRYRGRLMRFSVVLYRYIIVLGLPIAFLGLMVARLLKWTRILGSIGETIEQALSLVLSSVLGDVVTYAMDPAQAHRVRSAVESDIKFFHNHEKVDNIHLFAHSQGSAITFEVLFHHMANEYRKKIKTLVTIGSVLSYYNQAKPVLDLVPTQRFSKREYINLKTDPNLFPFASSFRWMNFWNLIDPITEFYGLDEYVDVEHVDRHPCSPINIKTKATLKNHSEYWSNQDQVQGPFVDRILGTGNYVPTAWEPQSGEVPKGLPHQWRVLLLWVGATLVFWFGLWLLSQQFHYLDWGNLPLPVRSTLSEVFKTLVPDLFKSAQNMQDISTQIKWDALHKLSVMFTIGVGAIFMLVNFFFTLAIEVRRQWVSRRKRAESSDA